MNAASPRRSSAHTLLPECRFLAFYPLIMTGDQTMNILLLIVFRWGKRVSFSLNLMWAVRRETETLPELR